jgi:hypothetical protein
MKPMTSMFKSRQENRSKRAKHSPVETTPLHGGSNLLDGLDSPVDRNAGYPWGELSELPGIDPILGWQTNNISINELSVEREASELDGRPLDLRERPPQPFYRSQVASNPVSPISYPDNPIHSPLGAIDTMMLEQRRESGYGSIEQGYTVPSHQAMDLDQLSLITSPTSPDSSESPMHFHNRFEVPSLQRLSRSQTVPRPPVGHDADQNPIELDAGLDKYRIAAGGQLDIPVIEYMPLRPCEFNGRVVNNLIANKVDDASLTDPCYEQAKFNNESGRPVGEHAFRWSSWNEPHRRVLLLQSVSGMIEDLPQHVKMDLPMLQNGAEACLNEWGDALQSVWDDCGVQLVEEDLSHFVDGISRYVNELAEHPFSATNQIVNDDHVSHTSPAQHTGPKVKIPQRTAKIRRSRKRKSAGWDDGNFANRTRKISPSEQWTKPQTLHTRKPAHGSMSPPLMNR